LVHWYQDAKEHAASSAEDGGSLFFGMLVPNYMFLCNNYM